MTIIFYFSWFPWSYILFVSQFYWGTIGIPWTVCFKWTIGKFWYTHTHRTINTVKQWRLSVSLCTLQSVLFYLQANTAVLPALSSRGSLVPLSFLPLEWCHPHIWGCWCFSCPSWFWLVTHPARHFSRCD